MQNQNYTNTPQTQAGRPNIQTGCRKAGNPTKDTNSWEATETFPDNTSAEPASAATTSDFASFGKHKQLIQSFHIITLSHK